LRPAHRGAHNGNLNKEFYRLDTRANVDNESKIRRLQNKTGQVEIQTVNKRWYVDKMTVNFHSFGNELPRNNDSLCIRGITEKTMLNLDVEARLTVDWDIVSKKSPCVRTLSQSLNEAPSPKLKPLIVTLIRGERSRK
jgi:hypothetical protein